MRISLTGLSTTLAFGLLFVAQNAFPAAAETFKVDLAPIDINTCVETVSLQGTATVSQKVSVNPQGQLLVSVQVTIKGKGLGQASGTAYEFSHVIHQRIKTSGMSGGASVLMLFPNEHIRLISHGGLENASFDGAFRLTFSATGDLRVLEAQFDSDCGLVPPI